MTEIAALEPSECQERGPLEIRVARPEDDAARDAFVRAHEQSTFFHQSGWGRLVEEVFGHPCLDLLALRGEEIVGVLPLSHTRKPLGRGHLISVPYGVYGGPLARGEGPGDASVTAGLVEAAERLGRERGVGRVELRCKRDLGLGLPTSELYATFIQELPEDPDQVLARMPKRARAEVRKARDRHGLVTCEGAWYVDDLARMFNRSKRGLGSPGLPLHWFRSLVGTFGPEGTVLHLARRGDEPLAAILSFLWNGSICIYYIGVADGANREYKATNYLCAEVARWAAERGYTEFDWSRSRKDSGAFSFKKHQGAEPEDLPYQYVLVNAEGLPTFNPSNPKTQVLQKTWRKLPAWMTDRLSTPVSRWLP